MALFSGRGYARPRLDQFSSTSPITRDRLMTDRNAYISFLEGQLERVTSSCMSVQLLSERIEQMQSQISSLEDRLLSRSEGIGRVTDSSQSSTFARRELNDLIDRIAKIERSNGRSPPLQEDRIVLIEDACAKVADDAMAAIESMHKKLGEVQRKAAMDVAQQVAAAEQRMSAKLSESVRRITAVLKGVVAAQKSQPVRVSGDLSVLLSSPKLLETQQPVAQPSNRARTPPPTGTTRPRTPPVKTPPRTRSLTPPKGNEDEERKRKALELLAKELALLDQQQQRLN